MLNPVTTPSSIFKELDRFIPEQTGPDAETLQLRARVFLALIACGIGNMLWTAAYQILMGSVSAGVAAFGVLPVLFAMFIAMRRGVSVEVLTLSAMIFYLAVTVTVAFMTDGLWPGGIYFLALAPTLAVIMLGRDVGFRWLGVTLFAMALLGAAAFSGVRETPTSLSLEAIQSAGFRVAAILAIVVFAMAALYSSLHEEAQTRWREVAEQHHEGELKFRAITENANDLIAELDSEGRILYASPGYEEALGYLPSEIVGRKFTDATHPDDLEQTEKYWNLLLEKGAVTQSPLRFDSPQRGWRWLEVSMRSYPSSGGELRVVAITRDVTERINHEFLARRKEKLVAMGTMAAGAAHQLKNPLGSVVAAAQFAKISRDEPGFPSIAEEMLDRIEAEATRCGQVLRSMLSFSKEEPSERWIEQIDPAIYRAVRAVDTHLDRGEAEIVLSLLSSSARVLISPIEIEQVIINLLRNSIEAGSKVIVIGTVVQEDALQLTVSDDGAGISEAARDRIFDPFFTMRPESGSGLGLSIAREIIEDHSGRIEAVQAEGDGTVIQINLPLAEPGVPRPLLQ